MFLFFAILVTNLGSNSGEANVGAVVSRNTPLKKIWVKKVNIYKR